MTARRAFIDKSYVARTKHYLMAAVILDVADIEDTRALIRSVRRHRRAAFHWHDERPETRHQMLALVAASSPLQLVVVTKPVAERRQERARATCTGSLLAQLQAFDPPVDDVVFESRTATLDQRDPQRIEGLRVQGRADPELRYSFDTKAQPLLWLADAVAGAATSDLTTGTQYLDRLKGRLYRVEIPGAV